MSWFSSTKEPPRTIGEVMNAHPYSISCYEPVSAAKRVMGSHKIRHLPVVDGKQVIGVISDRDVKAAELAYRGREFEGRVLIREILIAEPYVVSPETPLKEVAMRMAKERFGSVVIREGAEVVGIFTTTDACRLLAELA